MKAALEKNYALEKLRIFCSDSMREQVKQFLLRNAARYQQWRNSVMGWMWASKHLRMRLPRDVALMIGKMIWKTRTIYESPSNGGDPHASTFGPRERACMREKVTH